MKSIDKIPFGELWSKALSRTLLTGIYIVKCVKCVFKIHNLGVSNPLLEIYLEITALENEYSFIRQICIEP